MRKKITSLESSLQTVRDATSKVEKELQESNAGFRETISNMEKELHTLNARKGWFDFKYVEIERKLEAANYQMSLLNRALRNQEVELERQKEAAKRTENKAWTLDWTRASRSLSGSC